LLRGQWQCGNPESGALGNVVTVGLQHSELLFNQKYVRRLQKNTGVNY